MKKRLILVFATFFIGAFFYVTTHGATNVVSFPDGAKNLQTITANTDAIIKNWADTLIIGSLEKNAGGCRIRLGDYSEDSQTDDYSQGMHFWQGYFWGAATATPSEDAANSCVCPTGTTRVLRRSQGNNKISSLDTTWWKEFRFVGTTFVFGWTTQCTQSYQNYPAGCMTGDPGCSCSYNYNNCLNRKGRYGCDGFVNFNYTEYLYNCVATSETLKQ